MGLNGTIAFVGRSKDGRIIDFMLSSRRTAKSARRSFAKALRLRDDRPPATINTYQNEAHGKAIR
ncbi:MAG: hypothetical protein ACLPID_09760 [Beijerinckiaceae bacterium]